MFSDQQQAQPWREERRFPANKSESRPRNLQFWSNVTDTSEWQSSKQYLQITSTEAGIWIEVSPLSPSANLSNRDNLQFGSKETDASKWQWLKQDWQITSIEAGTQMHIDPL
jgi:hypothetical protein